MPGTFKVLSKEQLLGGQVLSQPHLGSAPEDGNT